MKRGIEFELGGGACSLLTAMLRLPALHNMTAICTEYEVVTNQGNLELPSMVSAETLADELERQTPQVIFLNLKLLPPGEQGGEISDYEDFLRSPYALVCLITDLRCVEVYGKDEALLTELAELARKLGALNIGEKDEEDGRRVFSVV